MNGTAEAASFPGRPRMTGQWAGGANRAAGEPADPVPSSHGVAPETATEATASMRSVLICDDRAAIRLELSKTLRLGSGGSVHAVPDGWALLVAYQKAAREQVLVGIHSGNTVGIQAVRLLLETHPTAAPIVFGSITDIELLAAAYCGGAGGLLLWEPRML